LVFLLIERFLLGACDVAVIGLRHRALFLTAMWTRRKQMMLTPITTGVT
jgi:hypothetical protein